MSWIWNIQACNITLSYVLGMQINWMDQKIIYEDEWFTERISCYNPK